LLSQIRLSVCLSSVCIVRACLTSRHTDRHADSDLTGLYE